MKSPSREQNFEKRFFYKVNDNSRLRKTASKMYKNLTVTRLLHFWQYLTLFEPPDDNIKRKTGSSYRNIEKNLFDPWTNIADLDLDLKGSKVWGQIWKHFRYTTLSENMICKNIIPDFVK
jgi:hypothetical protein